MGYRIYDKAVARKKAVNFQYARDRDGCRNCAFSSLRIVEHGTHPKSYHCDMNTYNVPALGMCDKYVRKEKP